MPGPSNAITDVLGVTVGHATLISGEGRLVVGKGPVRTGVTAIRPRGTDSAPVFAAWYTLNGCGEMTGAIWLEESGTLLGPVLLTNTASVGTVREAATRWMLSRVPALFALPLVTETYDGFLNDINGMHIQHEHALAALEGASSGEVAEGNVGGGTGMICHGFKGGIGTASRRLDEEQGGWTVGVLVQANHGLRRNLRIAGAPVGQLITERMPLINPAGRVISASSIIVVVATDCPLLPHQLKRLAKRVPQGIARVGGMGENFSGDIFLAFSTAPLREVKEGGYFTVGMWPNNRIDPLFEATVQATEEAIVNSLIAAEDMTGIDGNTVYALPHDRLMEALRSYRVME
jgi:L-aminopeptidase/D-esterase-like protein